jgi:hypothetical protein
MVRGDFERLYLVNYRLLSKCLKYPGCVKVPEVVKRKFLYDKFRGNGRRGL